MGKFFIPMNPADFWWEGMVLIACGGGQSCQTSSYSFTEGVHVFELENHSKFNQ